MTPRGRSRTSGRRRSGDQPAAAPEANPQDPEGLYRLNDESHIAGALKKRVLLPRRCSFLMPAPDVLLPSGSGMRSSSGTLSLTLRSFLHLWSAGVQRLIRFTCRGVSAPSHVVADF
ncbi:hypothetical protein PIB30_043315 [Stylosanthes scabra]|uniref:Uncharacterized protein n=1 Tax=Stylosanthes scabra TaxID=79078 RepID=A0ABU6RFP8_9FABA|nr:hypothetical protein [Stylosanthes scabra]